MNTRTTEFRFGHVITLKLIKALSVAGAQDLGALFTGMTKKIFFKYHSDFIKKYKEWNCSNDKNL